MSIGISARATADAIKIKLIEMAKRGASLGITFFEMSCIFIFLSLICVIQKKYNCRKLLENVREDNLRL